MCVIFKKNSINSAYFNVCPDCPEVKKALIVAVLQMTSTSDLTHLLTYLKLRFMFQCRERDS
jgi:hypothetical protein